jgi:hypothetical protein
VMVRAQQPIGNMRADESGSTSDQHALHHRCSS